MKFLVAISSLFLIMLVSCSDSDTQDARLKVVLVDAPAEYDEINVDVQEVNIRFGASDETGEESEENENEENEENGSSAGWVNVSDFVPDEDGMNILEFTNGSEAVLVDRDVPVGVLGEIRLVLGDQNNIVVGDNESSLTIPSGSSSGLKIKINEELLAGITYKLILDFDASKSIIETGNGEFKLKPVIHARMEAQSGAIAGLVVPSTTNAVAYAIQDQDSSSSYTNESGNFLIQALDAGTYNVAVVSETDTLTVDGIEVFIGEVSDSGSFNFE
jgi:hypothetical protein